MTPNPLMPRQPVPALDLATTDGGRFILGAHPPEAFDLIVFYRGLHCPLCIKYLLELERLAPEFQKRGVRLVAISSDDASRGMQMAEKIGAKLLGFGYGLSMETARQWGLYISSGRGATSIGIEEPALFSEPGVFLIKPDGTLYYGSTQTMPFARPQLQDLLGAIDYAITKAYPARGEFAGPV